jgi:hypothetical protein
VKGNDDVATKARTLKGEGKQILNIYSSDLRNMGAKNELS